MSEKKFKNKTEIIGDIIYSLDIKPFKSCGGLWWNSTYFGDYDPYYDHLFDDYDDDCDGYFYMNSNFYEYKYIWRRGIISGIEKSRYPWYSIGDYIDMDSFGGKVGIRNRKIDSILGDERVKYVPTYGDLLNNI